MEGSTQERTKALPSKRVCVAISLLALALAVVHVLLPGMAIDAITIALVVVAIVPWLFPFVKSLELPGGVKLEMRDLQEAASRAETAGLLAVEPSRQEEQFSFEIVANHDPNLALAGLRIEIEKRLSQLVGAHGLTTNRPMGLGQSLRVLARAEVLTHEERSVLADMTNMLNSAVHGAMVDPHAAEWAINVGPRLLTSLDDRIRETRERPEHIGAL